MTTSAERPARASGPQVTLGTVAIVLGLALNFGMIVTYATAITSKLDRISRTSAGNCELLRAAIVLSIEQASSRSRLPGRARSLEQNFQRIVCGG